MDMAEVTDGAITVDTGIITAGVAVMATIMAGGTIAITGDLTQDSRAASLLLESRVTGA